jgi:hypothetical protein
MEMTYSAIRQRRVTPQESAYGEGNMMRLLSVLSNTEASCTARFRNPKRNYRAPDDRVVYDELCKQADSKDDGDVDIPVVNGSQSELD